MNHAANSQKANAFSNFLQRSADMKAALHATKRANGSVRRSFRDQAEYAIKMLNQDLLGVAI